MKKLMILGLLAGGVALFGTERKAHARHGCDSRSGFSISYGHNLRSYRSYSHSYHSPWQRSGRSSHGYYSRHRPHVGLSRPSVGFQYYRPGFSIGFGTRSSGYSRHYSHGHGCNCGCCGH